MKSVPHCPKWWVGLNKSGEQIVGRKLRNKYEVLIDALMQRLKERYIDILESLLISLKAFLSLQNVLIYILYIPDLSDIPDISDIM